MNNIKKFLTLEQLLIEKFSVLEIGCLLSKKSIFIDFVNTFGIINYFKFYDFYIELGKKFGNGFVYLIRGQYQGKIAYKIGKANSLKERLRKFEVIIPFDIELVYGCYVRNPLNFEKRLHNKFKHKRVAGEWFDLDEKDILTIFVDFIKEELDSCNVNLALLQEEQINKDDYIEYLESLLAMHGIKVNYAKKTN